MWHIVEGQAGSQFAVENGAIAVIVDALRASATAAALLEAGAIEVQCFKTVDQALDAKTAMPDALLYGERDGLPPEGFDYGNSPLDAGHAAGVPVLFTTTTGTVRLAETIDAPGAYMGSCVNALALIERLADVREDIVLIPAGKAGDPGFDADEDWAAAAFIAQLADAEVGEGALWFREWRQRLELDGIEPWFRRSPHGRRLIELGFERDVVYCARPNILKAVPTRIRDVVLADRRLEGRPVGS
jgi:2-phosphosulfolactate phosphatase